LSYLSPEITDLQKHRQVSDEDAKAYAESVGAVHMLCSAKTGLNVETLFLELTKGMIEKADAGGGSGGESTSTTAPSSRRALVIKDEPKESGGCCGS